MLPIIIAVIVIYVVNGAAATLRRLSVLRALPAIAIHLTIFLIFALLLGSLALVVATTVKQIFSVAPSDNEATGVVSDLGEKKYRR